jgi:hypothetical protein
VNIDIFKALPADAVRGRAVLEDRNGLGSAIEIGDGKAAEVELGENRVRLELMEDGGLKVVDMSEGGVSAKLDTLGEIPRSRFS